MKLLFDENLSPWRAARLADLFPESTHVHLQNLGHTGDPLIWEFAKIHGYAIVSKDSDYVDKAMQVGPPPKVIAITIGNSSTGQVESLLRMRFLDIAAFDAAANDALLFLP